LALLQQTQNDVIMAQERLDQTILTAPFAGVVAAVNLAKGEFASPGQTMVVISDLDHLQVETTDLSERDISQVKIGDPAIILVDALNQEFSGKVISISPLATTLGGDVVYKVTLAFDEKPEGVLGGMTADVTISKQD
jgi:HlyD family secretion protein